MHFNYELGAWAGFGLISWLLFRRYLWLSCIVAAAAGLAAVPLLRTTFDPEGSERIADFLSSDRIGLLFGAVGGIVTGSAIAAALCVPKDRNRRLAILMFVITGLFVALSERKSEILYPFQPSGEDSWKDGVCLQTTGSTCGPASLATCLRALGVPGKEGELSIEANTAADGTLFADLARAARRHGVVAAFHAHQRPEDVPLPAIASVTLPDGIDHFIAVIDRNGKRCIADPLTGGRPMEGKKFYQWSGMFLTLNKAAR
jgi:Peptidase C39 family